MTRTTAKEERTRHYKLKADRAQHRIDQIADEYLDTAAASDDWQRVVDAARSRIERLKAELLQAVTDRGTPGVIQADLQRMIYAILVELSRPDFANRALGIKKRGRR